VKVHLPGIQTREGGSEGGREGVDDEEEEEEKGVFADGFG
jgi:hypothetical protein